MSRPRVLNQKLAGVPEGAVYVGRPSKWGNPYSIGKGGTRAEVVALYEALVAKLMDEEGFREQLEDLRGKDLVCWCAPESCHADVLLRYANQPKEI